MYSIYILSSLFIEFFWDFKKGFEYFNFILVNFVIINKLLSVLVMIVVNNWILRLDYVYIYIY